MTMLNALVGVYFVIGFAVVTFGIFRHAASRDMPAIDMFASRLLVYLPCYLGLWPLMIDMLLNDDRPSWNQEKGNGEK